VVDCRRLGQSGDDGTESHERLVDVATLFEALTSSTEKSELVF